MRLQVYFRALLLAMLFMVFPFLATAQTTGTGHYLFSYFKGNGEDGLHLAYSTDGFTWRALNQDRSFLTPTAGKDKLMRDPSIVRGPDGTFHMVWTVSWGEKGFGYASSKDLIHWSEQRYIPVMEHESGTLNTWAPELFYDAANKQYLIFWASTIPGRYPETDGQDGSRYNHRIYYVTTKDFKKFSKTQLFYDHGFNVIDAMIVRAGAWYAMFLKDETNKPFPVQKNIRIAWSNRATGPYSPASVPVTGIYWAEGPTALNVGGTWFLYFDKYTEHRYGLLVSKDLQNWTDASDRLVVPNGIRHGTAFEVSEEVVRPLLDLK